MGFICDSETNRISDSKRCRLKQSDPRDSTHEGMKTNLSRLSSTIFASMEATAGIDGRDEGIDIHVENSSLGSGWTICKSVLLFTRILLLLPRD
jgi:hypothetical protein